MKVRFDRPHNTSNTWVTVVLRQNLALRSTRFVKGFLPNTLVWEVDEGGNTNQIPQLLWDTVDTFQ